MGEYSIPCNEMSSSAVLDRRPLVSVAMITYNHEPYIARAIEGVLRQRTEFPFELVIGEDASTDATREICLHYQRCHPDVIRILWSSENVSRDCSGNFYRTCQKCRGKYVALCEGDDYWTNPDKLQLQVDYLEEHSECAICFHPVRVIWEDGRSDEYLYPANPGWFAMHEPSLNDLLRSNFIQTNSVMYRWNADGKLFDDFPLYELPGDWMLNLLHARAGRIGYIDEVMAVYRRNANGLWTGVWTDERWFRRVGLRSLYFHKTVCRLFGGKRSGTIRRLSLATLGALVEEPGEFENDKIKKLIELVHPNAVWVRASALLQWMYRVLLIVSPKRFRHSLEVRRAVWQIVCRHAKKINEVLARLDK